jgi:hypothetical protein
MVRQRVATLDITAEEGAELQAGGKLLGRAPLARPVFVVPGTYTITATRKGTTTTRSITVAPDSRLRVDLRSSAPIAPRSDAPRRRRPSRRPREPPRSPRRPRASSGRRRPRQPRLARRCASSWVVSWSSPGL